MTGAVLVELTARQLNRTTLLRQSLLERSTEDPVTAVAGDVIRAKNGDFQPAFTVDGYVARTWSVVTAPGLTVLEMAPSVQVATADRTELTEEAERLIRFVAPEANRHVVRWRR